MNLAEIFAKNDELDRLEREAQAEREREKAYAAVSRAITSYRSWGFTALLCRFRMFCTSIRIRLGMKLWP